jgi:hypothetical protein
MKTIKLITKLIKIVIILVLPSISVASETVTGKFIGLISLPNYKEALIIAEPKESEEKADLIVFKLNSKYYRILNMPISEKEKYVGKSAKVTGDFNTEHYTIEAEQIKVKKRTRYVKVWSDEELISINKWKEWKQKQFEGGYTPEGTGG